MDRKKFSLQTAADYSQHYTDEGFWHKLRHIAAKAGGKALYPALQLYYLLLSGNVALSDKAVIVGALGYLVLPVDAIPDFIPALGLTDDLTALMLALRTVHGNITDDIRQRARRQTDSLLGKA